MDLTVLLLTKNEANNLKAIIPQIKSILDKISMKYEVVVVDAGSNDGSKELCEKLGVGFMVQKEPGFGRALADGISFSRGERILTIDADLQHDPKTIPRMLNTNSDVVIGSRWIEDTAVNLPFPRKILSLGLNAVFSKFLKINVKDMSSNFRLYRKDVFEDMKIEGKNFDVLQEILIKCVNNGYKITEVPINFRERSSGKSNVMLSKFLVSYIKTFLKAWRMRISCEAVDYDERAYNSTIPLQRYWQRKRFRDVMRFVGEHKTVLDLGCGSSMIIQTLVKEGRGIGADISFHKLKYLKNKSKGMYVQCDVQKTCFKDNSVSCVIYSNVIEHVKNPANSVDECARILEDGGHLILATPDFSNIIWRITEFFYDLIKTGKSYKSEHISPLTEKEISRMLEARGLNIEETDGIFFNSEIILRAIKKSSAEHI